MGILLLASGCTPNTLSLSSEPSATPLPTPTPTPLPSAAPGAEAYLSAWAAGNYAAMYSMLTPESRIRVSLDEFSRRYQQAQSVATVNQVSAQLQSLLADGPQAAATFQTLWDTARFGQIQVNNQMALQFIDGNWGVVWQPTLVLPQLGEGIRLAFLADQPTRGNIYDRTFHAMATFGELVTVGVVPQFITDEAPVVMLLSQLTAVPPETIRQKIAAARPDWFVPIADVTFEKSLQFNDQLDALPGIERRARTVRTYPDADIGAHIVGYMGSIPAETLDDYLAQGYSGDERVGLTGVEGWAEPELAGKRGGRLVSIGQAGQVLADVGAAQSRAGSSVYLTIDSGFQAAIERLLGPRKGAIVVMDPNSGAVHALATYPRFNPTVFSFDVNSSAWTGLYGDPNRPLLGRATQGTYPPGSIFKIVSIAAALESLGLDPNHTFTCTGRWQGLGPEFVKECWRKQGHGQISLLNGLTQSCNVVFYEVGLMLYRTDPNLLPDWSRNFGLGNFTGIFGLGEESRGVVPDNDWKLAALGEPLYPGDAVNAAIGQGFTLVTPLQIARVLAAIANGGQLIRPRVIERIVAVDGTETAIEPEVSGTLPMLPETLELIRSSLSAVTSEAGGTARQVFEGVDYTVAGKTGTAESGQEEPHAWFAGYAPTDQPRVAIAVVVEESGEGSKVAAPLFRQVLETFFNWEANFG
ncbi:MAG: penicillin-binding protein 2 [Anaerolineae bacterium]